MKKFLALALCILTLGVLVTACSQQKSFAGEVVSANKEENKITLRQDNVEAVFGVSENVKLNILVEGLTAEDIKSAGMTGLLAEVKYTESKDSEVPVAEEITVTEILPRFCNFTAVIEDIDDGFYIVKPLTSEKNISAYEKLWVKEEHVNAHREPVVNDTIKVFYNGKITEGEHNSPEKIFSIQLLKEKAE